MHLTTSRSRSTAGARSLRRGDPVTGRSYPSCPTRAMPARSPFRPGVRFFRTRLTRASLPSRACPAIFAHRGRPGRGSRAGAKRPHPRTCSPALRRLRDRTAPPGSLQREATPVNGRHREHARRSAPGGTERWCRVGYALDAADGRFEAVPESLFEIARRIARAPWNRPGTDKTWVLNAMAQGLRFQREVRQAKRVERG